MHAAETVECLSCNRLGLGALDYKNISYIRQFISGLGRILPARKTGMCPMHQQLLGLSVKRARYMALLPKI